MFESIISFIDRLVVVFFGRIKIKIPFLRRVVEMKVVKRERKVELVERAFCSSTIKKVTYLMAFQSKYKRIEMKVSERVYEKFFMGSPVLIRYVYIFGMIYSEIDIASLRGKELTIT